MYCAFNRIYWTGYFKAKEKEDNIICEICGNEVFFNKNPEYDVCSRCDKKICINCGTPDLINGDSMCKEHLKEKGDNNA